MPSVEELSGEKIDIINWDENPAILIENALESCKSNCQLLADPEEKTALVVVPDYQLSLAIGKEGQNARLAARLTGFKIDIKSETQARESGRFTMGFYDEDEESGDEYAENASRSRVRYSKRLVAEEQEAADHENRQRKIPMRQCIRLQGNEK